ncbi:O-antigen ligase family protein [Salinibacterium sp. G-O1]|uniref:O-antigen ligase family protein n=1 Tax=Salinibacterium sp. G-O1 TaxID=3046208 RepID=UPI0024BA0B6E|nr:O-antigen ligase family protein [Salinibacterium sp. G-O1]MDJ0335414.1 O-antigen ligase family protein [Salinibacterium sp. G-O1]
MLELVLGVAAVPLLFLALWSLANLDALVIVLISSSFLTVVSFPLGPALVRIDAIVALVVLLVIAVRRDEREHGRAARMRWAYFALLFSLGVVAFWSSTANALAPVRSYFMLANFAVGGLVLFALWGLHLDWAKIVRVGTWVLFVICALSLLELLAFPGTSTLSAAPQGGNSFRVRGLSLEPNLMGATCVGWLAVMYYWRRSLSRRYGLIASVIAVACVLTNTRAAWLALVLLAIFVLWDLRSKIGVFIPIGAALFMVVLAILAPITQSAERGTFAWKIGNLLASDTGTGLYRVRTWDIAFNDIATSSAHQFGLGVNSYSQRHPLDLTQATEGYLSNLWIGWLYDAGIVGLVIFCGLLVVVFLASAKRFDAIPVFAALLICATLTNSYWMLFPWLCMTLVLPNQEGPDAGRYQRLRAANIDLVSSKRGRLP